jgi:hypothetical protein
MSGRGLLELLDLLAEPAGEESLARSVVRLVQSMEPSRLEAGFDLALRSGMLEHQGAAALLQGLRASGGTEGAELDEGLAQLRAEVSRLESAALEEKSRQPRRAALRGEIVELERRRGELVETITATRQELATLAAEEEKLMGIAGEVAR